MRDQLTRNENTKTTTN